MAPYLLLIISVAFAWRLYLWSRAPHDAPTRSVALTLLAMGLSNAVAGLGRATDLDAIIGHDMVKLVENLLLLLACFFLMCFYLHSSVGRAARRRARVEGVVVAVVAVAITVAVLSAPHGAFSEPFRTVDMTIPQVACFYLGAGLYMTYVIALAGRWSARYARMSSRPHATGLWVAAIGLSALAVACGVRAVFVAVRWGGGAVPGPLSTGAAALVMLSSLLFVTGVTYSGVRARVTAARLWLRRRRDHRRLESLWQLLIEVYPENQLPPASRTRWDQWRARGVHRRYHRRIVECRDGLVDISPYLLSEEDEPGLLRLDPTELARRLRHASAAIQHGAPVPERAVSLAVPQGDDRDSDVGELIAVSEALRLTT
ncbi:MAB_1171c family putative transporter [Streptomyces sp. SCSIO 30461]|uniref:MAB_1171c family putative transporter n=1 Tax=Streptomyces sp. SCSIO 30461 TaxID=3118085 RepID=UPI0030CE6FD3